MTKIRWKTLSQQKTYGFTIIEILIVLLIVVVILATIFLAVPALQASKRDYQRKEYTERVYAALLEFYSIYGTFPACDTSVGLPCGPAVRDFAVRFITVHMPAGVDPFTGEPYTSASAITSPNDARTSSGSVIYVFNAGAVDHSFKPQVDQIFIGSGHWCYSSRPDNGPSSNLIASTSLAGPDRQPLKFVILIGLERNRYFCLDNA